MTLGQGENPVPDDPPPVLDPVTLHDIYTRLGGLESGQTGIRAEIAGLKAEVHACLVVKPSLRERVRVLEGRWNRLVGGFILLAAGVGAFEVWEAFIR